MAIENLVLPRRSPGVGPVSRLVLVALVLTTPYLLGAPLFWPAMTLVVAPACVCLIPLTGWLRQLSFAQAGLLGVSAYVTATFFSAYVSEWQAHGPYDTSGLRPGPEWPLSLAAVMGIGVAVALAGLFALASVRRGGAVLVVATVALQLVAMQAPLVPGRLGERYLCAFCGPARPWTLFGLDLADPTAGYAIVVTVTLAIVAGVVRLRYTRFGRAMTAVGSDPESAAALGIDPGRYRAAGLMIAGFGAGVSGALHVLVHADPTGDYAYGVEATFFVLAVALAAGRSPGAAATISLGVWAAQAYLPNGYQIWEGRFGTVNQVTAAGAVLLVAVAVRALRATSRESLSSIWV